MRPVLCVMEWRTAVLVSVVKFNHNFDVETSIFKCVGEIRIPCEEVRVVPSNSIRFGIANFGFKST